MTKICLAAPLFKMVLAIFVYCILIIFSFDATAETPQSNQVFNLPVNESNSDTFWQIAKTLNQRRQFQSHFSQEKHIKVLRRPLKSAGTILFSFEHGLCWKTAEPFQSTLSITRQGIFQKKAGGSFQAVAAQQHAVASDITSVFLAVFSGEREVLEQNFMPHLSGTTSQWVIGLKPRSKMIQVFLDAIVLKGNSSITDLEIWEENGDFSLIKFYNQETDVRVFGEEQKECFDF